MVDDLFQALKALADEGDDLDVTNKITRMVEDLRHRCR
jgi:hypothetical protein